jgi:hypothetical protein
MERVAVMDAVGNAGEDDRGGECGEDHDLSTVVDQMRLSIKPGPHASACVERRQKKHE